MNIHEREICKSSPDDDMMKNIHNRQICKSSDYDDDNDDEYSQMINLQIIT